MLERLKYYILLIVGFSLCLVVPNLHNLAIIILIAVWLLKIRNFKWQFIKNELFWAFTLVYLLILFGVFFSENLNYGLSFAETSFTLLALPIILFGDSKELENGKVLQIMIAFVIGIITLNLLSLFFISYNLWDTKNLQTNLIAANNVIVRIHPILLSMYISFCIFFITDRYFPLHKLDRVRLGWVLFSLAVLIVFLLWLNSRAGILAFLLASLFFIGYRWQGRTRIIGYSSLVLFGLILVSVPFSNYRFVKAPQMVLSSDGHVNHGDSNIFPLENRLQILKCNIELLRWPEIIYGYGTGDGRDELQKCFAANNYVRPLSENMDSHSEYFAQIHRSGIIGLGLFLALLIVPFRHALKYQSPLLGAFIILFAVTAMFENVFSAQKGVTFFALFCPLLWIMAKQEYEVKMNSSSTSVSG